jgi:hypothetical protein
MAPLMILALALIAVAAAVVLATVAARRAPRPRRSEVVIPLRRSRRR